MKVKIRAPQTDFQYLIDMTDPQSLLLCIKLQLLKFILMLSLILISTIHWLECGAPRAEFSNIKKNKFNKDKALCAIKD